MGGAPPSCAAAAVDDVREPAEAAFAPIPEAAFAVLLFARHAKQQSGAHRRPDDERDPPLSELGEAQASALAARLASVLPSGTPVWSSPMWRARSTARPLARALEVPLRIHGGIFEYKSTAGRPAAELQRAEESEDVVIDPRHFGDDGAWALAAVETSDADAGARARAAAAEHWIETDLLEAASRGVAAVIVSHQTFLDLLLQRLLLRDERGWRYGSPRYKISHAGLIAVAVERGSDSVVYTHVDFADVAGWLR